MAQSSSNAPHLPSQNEEKKQTSFAYGAFISFAIVALVAGIAATLATIAWIVPSTQSNTPIYTIRSQRPVSDTAFDPFVEQQVRQRLVTVYRQSDDQSSVLAQKDTVGTGVLLSAQGWIVTYPSQGISETDTLIAVTHTGSVVPVEMQVQDPLSELVYLKLAPGEYRADVSFVSPAEQLTNTPYIAVSRAATEPVLVDEIVSLTPDTVTYPVWQPQYTRRLIGDVDGGEVITTPGGAFVGFARPDGTLVDSWRVEEQLVSLFQQQEISYQGLPYTGYVVEGIIDENVFQKQAGFYIEEITSSSRNTVSAPQVGDVIIAVNDRPFSKETIAAVIAAAPETVQVTVMRDGEELTFMVPKVSVQI